MYYLTYNFQDNDSFGYILVQWQGNWSLRVAKQTLSTYSWFPFVGVDQKRESMYAGKTLLFSVSASNFTSKAMCLCSKSGNR